MGTIEALGRLDILRSFAFTPLQASGKWCMEKGPSQSIYTVNGTAAGRVSVYLVQRYYIYIYIYICFCPSMKIQAYTCIVCQGCYSLASFFCPTSTVPDLFPGLVAAQDFDCTNVPGSFPDV